MFNGTINLLSEVNLSNWKLSTKTQFKSLDWNESPSVIVLGKSVPITYLVNPALRFFKEKMEKSIDDAIDSVKVEFIRFDYDIDKAAKGIEDSPLPDEFAERLRKAF
jgi:hypothetical protein